jgi:uncharacterized alkaline shock family protein YloU
MDEPLGEVTIAPNVLTTIVRQTALEQRGVTRLAPLPPKVRGRGSMVRAADDGVFVAVTEQGVRIEVHLAAENGINLLRLGESLQASITRAIEEMVCMTVSSVDVYIDEVTLATLPPTQDN